MKTRVIKGENRVEIYADGRFVGEVSGDRDIGIEDLRMVEGLYLPACMGPIILSVYYAKHIIAHLELFPDEIEVVDEKVKEVEQKEKPEYGELSLIKAEVVTRKNLVYLYESNRFVGYVSGDPDSNIWMDKFISNLGRREMIHFGIYYAEKRVANLFFYPNEVVW